MSYPRALLIAFATFGSMPAFATMVPITHDIRIWLKADCAENFIKVLKTKGADLLRIQSSKDYVLVEALEANLNSDWFMKFVVLGIEPDSSCVLATRTKSPSDDKWSE